MRFKRLIKNPFILLLISAVFSALPMTFSSLFWLSWVSFVPFFYVIIKHSGTRLRFSFASGFLFGFIYHLCIYYWFLWFYPLDFAGLSNAASVALVLLASVGISAVHGVLWCVPTVLCHFAERLNKSYVFLSAVAIIGIISAQKLTAIGELSFPWARISLGQYKATALIQSASLFGIDGVDMLILTINALITIFIISQNKKRITALVAAVVLFCTNMLFGAAKINTAEGGDEITVMAVQGSVEGEQKWSYDGDKICYDAYSALTKENITDDVDIILWPESAVPKVYKNEKSLKQYKALSKELKTPILVGVLLKNDGEYTNNAVLIDGGDISGNYAKRQLVPFGEYMPYQNLLSKIFPFLDELNIIEDDYVCGTDSAVMEISGGNFGSIICFESIYPALCRQSVLDGAELMVEITNDSWLKDSPAMRQHLAHGVFRSVENGRCLVRSANSGISAVIDSHGNIVGQLDVNEQGVLIGTAYFSDKTTLYTKTGNILFPVCVCLLVVTSAVLSIKKLKQNKKVAD